MTGRRFAFLMVLLAAFATALSACGRRADLETPSEARARIQAEADGTAVDPDELPPQKPDRPFFLDALID